MKCLLNQFPPRQSSILLLKLSFLLFLIGCAGHKNRQQLSPGEIYWPDVVFPLDASYMSVEQGDGFDAKVIYTSQLSIAEIMNLYKKEMERLGWETVSEAQSYFVLFYKPGVFISVIANFTNQSEIIVIRSSAAKSQMFR